MPSDTVPDFTLDLPPFTGTASEVADLNRLWTAYGDALCYPANADRSMSHLQRYLSRRNEPSDRDTVLKFRERLILVSMRRATAAGEQAFSHLRRR